MVGEMNDFTSSFSCCALRYHLFIVFMQLAISFMGLDGLWVV